MKRIERDIVALFNTLWYRDFPLSEVHKQTGDRAEWTTHIGICIRSISDLLGYFTHFEGGRRNDAVIKDNTGHAIANIEWEWTQPFNESVNEIGKLYSQRNEADISLFIGYSRNDKYEQNMKKIENLWLSDDKILVVFLITFRMERNDNKRKKVRVFEDLKTYEFKAGKHKNTRTQPALPWMLSGTKWEKPNQEDAPGLKAVR